MTHLPLYHQINLLPEALRVEVSHFIEFLLSKQTNKQMLPKRQFGFAKNKIKISDSFDEPLEEFNEYMP